MDNCNKCLWATRNGSCASWDCEFVDKQEAYEAVKYRKKMYSLMDDVCKNGMEGKETDFRYKGRAFRIREVAQ